MNENDLRRMYEEERMSIHKIAKQLGKSYSDVRYYLLKYGIKLRDRKQGVIEAFKDGRPGSGHAQPHTAEARTKMSEARRKRAELTAVGFSIKPNGYVEYTRGTNKGRSVHVVTMEEHIGRKLNKNEVVHHINRNRSDNRLENLQLMTRAEHSRLHRKEEQFQTN